MVVVATRPILVFHIDFTRPIGIGIKTVTSMMIQPHWKMCEMRGYLLLYWVKQQQKGAKKRRGFDDDDPTDENATILSATV